MGLRAIRISLLAFNGAAPRSGHGPDAIALDLVAKQAARAHLEAAKWRVRACDGSPVTHAVSVGDTYTHERVLCCALAQWRAAV